jgi:hypothetical protein
VGRTLPSPKSEAKLTMLRFDEGYESVVTPMRPLSPTKIFYEPPKRALPSSHKKNPFVPQDGHVESVRKFRAMRRSFGGENRARRCWVRWFARRRGDRCALFFIAFGCD